MDDAAANMMSSPGPRQGARGDPVRELMRQQYLGNPRGEQQSSSLRAALYNLTRAVDKVDSAQIASPLGDGLVGRTLELLHFVQNGIAEALASPSAESGSDPLPRQAMVSPQQVLSPRLSTLSQRFIESLNDATWEPGLCDYGSDLLRINAIVVRTNEGRAEGSLFYPWGVEPFDRPHPEFLNRRRNFALLAAISTRMIEVGINAGHSCILALRINPELHYTGIDWAGHPYSHDCLDELEKLFAERISVIREDSRRALANLSATDVECFDFVHLDGGHDFTLVMSDLKLAAQLSRPGGLILVDDDDMFPVYAACDYAILEGWVEPVGLGALWAPAKQRLLRATAEKATPRKIDSEL